MVRALGADTGGPGSRARTGRFLPIVGYHGPRDVLHGPRRESLMALNPQASDGGGWSGPCTPPTARPTPIRPPPGAAGSHKSVFIQPMRWKGGNIGGFVVVWLKEQHRFTPDELRLAEGIALQAAVASENSRLYEGVKQQYAELQRTQASCSSLRSWPPSGSWRPTSPTRSTTR